jgi:nucleotide-binding universal stress UspA family protein
MFADLRAGLPEYVRYRNEGRGHYALGGKPALTRLQEQHWVALPAVLERLESFARHPLGATSVEVNSCIRVLGRNGYIPNLRYRQKVWLTETLDGLEALLEEVALKTRAQLKELAESPRLSGMRVKTDVRVGKPFVELISTCRSWQGDLIIVGATKQGEERFLGSTGERVLRKAPLPVLVAQRARPGGPTTILVPTDFSPGAKQAAEEALALVRG